MEQTRPKLAFALGGGAALGLAHIGILQVMDEIGLKPDFIVGTSMGALVGAAYAAGRLAETEALACKLGPADYFSHLTDFAFVRAGLLKGQRLMDLLQDQFGNRRVEALGIEFHAVAADLLSGAEVVISEGPVVDALRASSSLPWIFAPVMQEGRMLVDGGMRAPVPMLACRRLGATHMVAVHVAGDHGGRVVASAIDRARAALKPVPPKGSKIAAIAFALQADALVDAHRELARPDVFLEPLLGGHDMMHFHRAKDLIAIGRAHARAQLPALEALRDTVAAG